MVSKVLIPRSGECGVTQLMEENRPLVTGEPAEFEKQPAEDQAFEKIMDHFRGI